MRDHSHLIALNEASLAQQAAVRRATFSPDEKKTLRPFSIWEMSQFMFGVPADTLRKKLSDDPSLPQGAVLDDGGRQRWFTLDEINELRRRVRFRGRSLLPERPPGRAVRVAVANFKGGVGKSVVAQHFANAAALDGYRVLVVDFDPQATLTHCMGLTEVREENTVWGILCRDLCREADRIAASYDDPEDCPLPRRRGVAAGRAGRRPAPGAGFHRPDLLADHRHHPLLRQRGLCGVRLRPVPRAPQGLVVLRLHRALSR